jgi:hypothetical protein
LMIKKNFAFRLACWLVLATWWPVLATWLIRQFFLGFRQVFRWLIILFSQGGFGLFFKSTQGSSER